MAKKRRISVRSGKAKGRRLQQHVRDLFYKIAADSGEAGEGVSTENGDIESRQMGGTGNDVIFHTPLAKTLFPYYVECKAAKRGFNPHLFFEQLTKLAKKDGTHPLLFHKRDNGQPLVTMSEKLFADMASLVAEHLYDKETDY